MTVDEIIRMITALAKVVEANEYRYNSVAS